MEIQEWINKNSNIKGYAHFDTRISLKEVFNEVTDSNFIIKHAFMPFIHYSLTFHKFSKLNGRKDKIRQLYYSAHYDRCIYQYYSYLLNERYNEKASLLNINNVAIAYRTNLQKNNIHFAKEAFDFIKQQEHCFIIVGDFKDFFDTLEHNYLKQKLCELLEVEVLPNDYYKVFKSITKYSYVNLQDILSFYGLEDTLPNRKKLNSKEVIMPIQKLRQHKDLIQTNKNSFGIPQGSAMSAILSNIYMLDFDVKIKNYVQKFGGKYFRYSDDTIFIFPIDDDKSILKIHSEIRKMIQSIPNLVLQTEKTKIYSYKGGTLKNRDSLLGERIDDKNIIDYLGFSFDGLKISIRDKTISKYFYRAYKKADTIVKNGGYTHKGTKISCKNLYRVYTLKGSNPNKNQGNGNFLSYVKRCRQVFGKNENVDKVINTYYGKIKRRLKNEL